MAYLLDHRRCALLVIDPQERLMAAIHKAERVSRNTALLVRAAKELSMPILATTQYVKGLGPFVPELAELLEDVETIDKMEFNSFLNADFRRAAAALPASVDTLVITGVEAHICIYQTAVGAMSGAFGRSFECWIAEDAVSSRQKRNWKSAIRLLGQQGACCGPSELILYQWLERAGTSVFKAMLPYLK